MKNEDANNLISLMDEKGNLIFQLDLRRMDNKHIVFSNSDILLSKMIFKIFLSRLMRYAPSQIAPIVCTKFGVRMLNNMNAIP